MKWTQTSRFLRSADTYRRAVAFAFAFLGGTVAGALLSRPDHTWWAWWGPLIAASLFWTVIEPRPFPDRATLKAGDTIVISGASDPERNGTFVIGRVKAENGTTVTLNRKETP